VFVRTLRSLAWCALSALGALSAAHGCSGADEAPPSTVTSGTGGDGGSAGGAGDPGDASEGGGTAGTAGTGTFFDVPGTQVCDDPTDTDGDDIADEIEGSGDTDGDGTPDREDLDSDDDGVPDADEAANAGLEVGVPGQARTDACSGVANTDEDGDGPDFQDFDADGDGVLDDDEPTPATDSACGKDCRLEVDCDGDSVVDVVEVAAGSGICDGLPPPNAQLYFVVPYADPEQSRKFPFSTGVKDADVYFLIDTTASMQGAIDNVKASLDTTIIPTILNGDAAASPPIPAIPGAWIGIGDFKDVPWAPWGVPGDDIYRHRYCLGGSFVSGACTGGTETYGNVSEPNSNGSTFSAPDNVKDILGALTAGGGGDAPEGATQALYMAVTTGAYAATAGGLWSPADAACATGNLIGRACFRPGKLPVFAIITDTAFHNGPRVGTMPQGFDYDPPPPLGSGNVGGTRTYQEVVAKLNDISAKIVGVSVNTGTPGQARSDLTDLAEKTGSLYYDPAFGGADKPLVTEQDTSSGDVSTEVVRLIGLLAGQGLNNVTTVTTNYDCAGGIDCTGDGLPDAEYHNFTDNQSGQPFDASQLVTRVEPVASNANPKPYQSINDTTFFGVRGDQTVEFEVFAENQVLKPSSLVVIRAILRVQTPSGQALGGAEGVKVIYLVVPRYREPFF
jgi:hypothetical protein